MNISSNLVRAIYQKKSFLYHTSDVLHELVHFNLVPCVHDLIVLDQINLQKQVLCVSDELLADFSSLLVCLELWILLTSVQALLVRVNLGFDLT